MKTEHVTEKYLAEMVEYAGTVKIVNQKYSLILTWQQKEGLASELKKLLDKAYLDGLKNRSVNTL